MYTLQGMISKLADNSNRQFDALGFVSKNTANYSTVGYKKVRFEEYLQDNGITTGVARTDFTPGAISITDKELDVAINGVGFIPVTSKDGKQYFTREGSFKINSSGYICTLDDYIVGDGIKVPEGYEKIKIKSDGTVMARAKKEGNFEKIGSIPLVSFKNPEGLTESGNKYTATATSGDAFYIEKPDYIKQGFIERSNVNMYEAVEEVLRLNGSLLSSTALIKLVDSLYKESISLRQ